MAIAPVWKRRLLLYGGAAAALLAGNWIFDRLSRRAAGVQQILPFTDTAGSETCAAWSPDGRRVAFVWQPEDRTDAYRLYVKPVAGGPAKALTSGWGSEWSPAWSPDGAAIAFSRMDGGRAGYYLIPVSGGAERELAAFSRSDDDAVQPALSWMPDGRRLAAIWRESGQAAGIYVLGLDGSRRRLTAAPAGSPGDAMPAVSRDGRRVAFVRLTAKDAGDLYVVPAEGGEPQRVTFDNKPIAGVAWSPDGSEIVFASARLDRYRLWRVSAGGGTPRDLPYTNVGATWPAVSRAGKLLFTRTAPDSNIWRVDLRDAQHPARRFISSPRREWAAQYAPDGRRVVFLSDRSGSDEVWLCDSEGRNPVQLTSLNLLLAEPRWSPDGRTIVFARRGVQPSLYQVSSSGGTARQIAIPNVAFASSPNWSRDGRSLYFFGEDRLWKVPATGGKAVGITRHPGFAAEEALDGKSVYYQFAGRVWKTDDSGQGGEPISDFLRPLDAESWWLSKSGIYFVEWQRDDRGYPLRLYDLNGREARELVTLERFRRGDPTFAISPDERYVLYSKGEETTDVMLGELK